MHQMWAILLEYSNNDNYVVTIIGKVGCIAVQLAS